MIGPIGHVALVVAFVASLAALVSFALASRQAPDAGWARIGRWSWATVGAGVVVASAMLWTALFGGHYDLAYVYQQTSTAMPFRYTLSAFWAGQEGSFLLWIIMTTIVGGLLIRWSVRSDGGEPATEARRVFAAPVLAVVSLCQAFLLSMVVGLQLGSVAVGASPFVTLAEKFPDAPMLQVAGFVPADGQGLNDLLQNPWMTIHPPTLFVGFTLLMVPFAFAVAGLYRKRYTQWVKPALPWALAGTGVLGVGIMMGGWWAYETLSFGGWWAWDPVENSSLVPWIFAVAGLHAMVVQKKTAAGHKAALWLSVLAFQLVIYSTFLTRSGILGDVSVHSFVDLGLYNQLLLWISAVGILGFGMLAWRWRDLPAPATPPAVLSRESLVFTGALLLAVTGGVIALGTSAPIFGKLFRDNPSAVPVEFYTTWTVPLAVAIAFLGGMAQLFWWRKMSVEDANRVLFRPVVATVVSTAAVVLLTPFVQETVAPGPGLGVEAPVAAAAEAGILPTAISTFFATHGTSLLLLLLLFASFFMLWGNLSVMWRVGRGNLKMVGGSLTHVGFGLVLLGTFASSVFNDPISDGNGTDIQGRRDNVVVPLGRTVAADGYRWTYTGQEVNAEGRPVYVMDVVNRNGEQFQTRNVVYKDGRDQWIQHPDVREGVVKDLYVAVFPSAMSENTGEGQAETELARGEAVALSTPARDDAYSVTFVDYELEVDLDAVGLVASEVDLAVAARLEVTNHATGETRTLRPVYVITTDGQQQFVQNRTLDWGLGVAFAGMVVDEGAIRLVFEGATVAAEDWVVVQAYEKPWISLLWLGTGIVGLGFGIAFARRIGEARR
ncbi:cytochrome c biogenesis protein CcsA [Rubrivirga sp. IMCC43871]|uniref:cytochrome c biogenesis protein CcsA n=1 Tax=Rubrivirga sp. IMCC43871 TaxID=3391575 RepID=UPI00398FBFA8